MFSEFFLIFPLPFLRTLFAHLQLPPTFAGFSFLFCFPSFQILNSIRFPLLIFRLLHLFSYFLMVSFLSFFVCAKRMKATAAMPADSTPNTPSKKTFLNINAAESSSRCRCCSCFCRCRCSCSCSCSCCCSLAEKHTTCYYYNYTILCRFTFIISDLFPFFILVVWCLKNL